MTVIRGLILAILALPVAEIAVFILVASIIGFGWALALIALSAAMGVLILRRAGGAHIARIRMAVGENRLSALQADGTGVMTLIAGFLLLVPGFITSAIGLLMLAGGLFFGFGTPRPGAANDNVVDLDRKDWRQVPDPQIGSDTNRHKPR